VARRHGRPPGLDVGRHEPDEAHPSCLTDPHYAAIVRIRVLTIDDAQ
jgi:hypothetical protein